MGGIEDVPYSVLFRRPYPEDVRVEKFLVIVGRFTIICSEVCEGVTSKNNISSQETLQSLLYFKRHSNISIYILPFLYKLHFQQNQKS